MFFVGRVLVQEFGEEALGFRSERHSSKNATTVRCLRNHIDISYIKVYPVVLHLHNSTRPESWQSHTSIHQVREINTSNESLPSRQCISIHPSVSSCLALFFLSRPSAHGDQQSTHVF